MTKQLNMHIGHGIPLPLGRYKELCAMAGLQDPEEGWRRAFKAWADRLLQAGDYHSMMFKIPQGIGHTTALEVIALDALLRGATWIGVMGCTAQESRRMVTSLERMFRAVELAEPGRASFRHRVKALPGMDSKDGMRQMCNAGTLGRRWNFAVKGLDSEMIWIEGVEPACKQQRFRQGEYDVYELTERGPLDETRGSTGVAASWLR